MTKADLVNSVSRTFSKVGFKLKKHSPEILVVAGVLGTITSAVMACKATTNVKDILDEAKDTIDAVHDTVEKIENGEAVYYADENNKKAEYTLETSKKDLTVVYAQTGVKLVKLYAPSVILGALSLTAIITSNNILRKRNVALAAAYATVEKSFKEYRGRVVERFGKELDRELKYNIKATEVEETVTNEDGSESTVKKTANVIDPNTIDDSARIWDDGNPGWSKDPEFNLMYLKRQQSYATDKLRRNGYLFLNEVYDLLGYPRTAAGQQIGWIYDEKNPIGDNFVDFGIYDIHNRQKASFVNGYERSILLEFNHDGNILDKM